MTEQVRRRVGRWILGVVAGLGLVGATASPVFADPPGPTDYQSEVLSIVPETPTIEVGIVGGDSFVELSVEPGIEAMVVGYEGEDYLWFRPDGVVLENQNSPATYLNANRYGIDGVPATARADAEPSWEQVATGGHWAWHDHRAHWMQSARPFGLEAGDQILEAVIPIVVDGETVEVTVISTWQPAPSPLAAEPTVPLPTPQSTGQYEPLSRSSTARGAPRSKAQLPPRLRGSGVVRWGAGVWVTCGPALQDRAPARRGTPLR